MQTVQNVPSYHAHSPALPCRSDEDVERYRKLREIHVEGTGVPKPVASFEEASFPGAQHCRLSAWAFSFAGRQAS